MQGRLFTCAALSSLLGLVFALRVGAEPLLEGRVRLASGEGVAHAQVRLFDVTDLRRFVGTTTDETGHFALPWAALSGRARPAAFALGPNYPNPFNPSTIIPYQLPSSSQVRLEVFNLLGQHLATLVDGERPAGFHTATWHATDGAGRAVGAGVYIYRMTVGAESQTGRMVLVDGQAGVSTAGAASVWSGASGGASDGERAQVYGLIVSGAGLVPYVDSAFRVESGMASVELVVSSGPYSAGKATDDDCALCDFLGAFNNQQEEEEDETPEEAETDSTASEGGPDLIVQPPSASAVVLTPGEAFTLQVTVQNQGDEQAAATILHYYRSNNTTITASDTPVGTGAVDALDASAMSPQSIALTASAGVQRYYGACVDSVRGEINTDNNCSAAVKITVSGPETPEAEEDTPDEEADETPEEGPETPEDVPDDAPVPIPDAKLRAAIAKALGKASGATITPGEMATLTTLDADDAGIRDLTGLEWAPNLTSLNLSYNNISDISALSGLTNLESLYLHVNDLRDLSALSGLTNLTHLNLINNDFRDLSALSGLTNLRSLYLGVNDFRDISALSGLTNLRSLHLSDNDLRDISALSGLTNLTWLFLGANDLRDISALSGLTNLRSLYLLYNEITDISALSGLTNLESLDLWVNDLRDISALSGLTNLRSLYLGVNDLRDISALSGLTNLTHLDLRGQPLSASSINDHIPALRRSGATVLFDPPLRESDFDIELVFLDDHFHFDKGDKRVIRYAARRWMSIIRQDLPDFTFTGGWSGSCGGRSYAIPSGERIDDLRIYVVSFNDYDDDAPAGWASLRVLRETSHLSVVGCMGFSDGNNVSFSTALHEIGHVLGIGTRGFEESGFVQKSPGDVHFNGPRAIAAFNDAGGRNYTGKKVPLEEDGAHWRASVLRGELMESTSDGRSVSAITIQALADVGYSVDVTQADPYTLPRARAAKVAALPGDRLMGRLAPQPEWSCGVGTARQPIHVVDEQGRIIRTLHR